jgi:hypothetical protein
MADQEYTFKRERRRRSGGARTSPYKVHKNIFLDCILVLISDDSLLFISKPSLNSSFWFILLS